MKQWEESIKNRLEGYESPLPEGWLAEFRAALPKARTARQRKIVVPWIVGIAVSACLAALLFLRHPAGVPAESPVTSPRPVAEAVRSNLESTVADAARPDRESLAVQVGASHAIAAVRSPQISDIPGNIEKAADLDPVSEQESIPQDTEPNQEEATASAQEPDKGFSPQRSPLPAENTHRRKMNLKAGAAAGGILSLSAIGALASMLPNLSSSSDMSAVQADAGGVLVDPSKPENKWTGECDHKMPLRLGLSARIPLSGRISLTTGIDYSLYSSSLKYTLSGNKTQLAHYIGVPLRMDWTAVQGKRLEAYLGAGIEGDICVAATLDGTAIRRDGLNLSLIGAGGAQLNMTKRLGLYVEPSLTCTMPWGRQVLNTYRSEHPLMFSVSAGVRITLGK